MKTLAIIVLVSLTVACDNSQDLTKIKSKDLVGVWSLKYTGEDVYPYYFSQLAFMDNGDKCILGYNFNSSGKVNINYYKSTYVVKDGVLISTVGYSSGPFGLPKGYIVEDKLIHYDESSFNVLMTKPKGDIPENHQKLVGVNPNVICNIVDQHIKNSKEAVDSYT